MNPALSVVVPAWNAARTLPDCLCAIRASMPGDGELIVVDDASTDATREIATRHADTVVVHPATQGEGASRNSGAKAARGDILVFVDSDVVVAPDALPRIRAFFDAHPHTAALTGRLSRTHQHANFFSQYKNLYMHYIFGLLPAQVGFLYGSIHAVRAAVFMPYPSGLRYGADTAAGMAYTRRGCAIAFLPELEVVHLKRHDARSFFRNDFCISSSWARLLILRQGYRTLFRRRTGFAHSPKRQLASVALAPCIAAALAARLMPAAAAMGLLYAALNAHFWHFMLCQRGFRFALLSTVVTFADNLVMAAGIACGAATSPWTARCVGSLLPFVAPLCR